jgi:short-subunit dehydrogenase
VSTESVDNYALRVTLPPPALARTSVVTGASSGIGEAIARNLANRGHGITLVARRADRLATLAAELERTGVRAEVLAIDLSDRAARAGLLERIEELELVPDILVNNAGFSTVGSVARSDPDAETQMLEVDVVAVADLCSRFVPGMVERGVGAVLNVASTAAFQPLPGQAGYAAAKSFVVSYTRALAAELSGTGVTATVLCPGPVRTEFGATAGFTDEEESALPSFMWEDVESVAKTGVNALDRGHVVAIPGAANQAAAMLASITPKRVLVPLLARRHPGLRR